MDNATCIFTLGKKLKIAIMIYIYIARLFIIDKRYQILRNKLHLS